ncbi:DUF7471 family protein [Saliphagus infecundisoli]|uniref:Uncharacterized protein n=1 Tax=Saliphagus infecundisoli TaxID=1849069 RepID=A0ABD5QAR0_9EURY|nr:hypothetical protein [Saliphagus infecundisoli]
MLAVSSRSSEWLDPQLAPVLVLIIVLAVVGTIVLFGLGLIAYSRRQTLRYLLITFVLGMLVARSVVGLGTVLGVVPMTIHHLIEHSFDFLISIIILYTVYRSGSPTDTPSIKNKQT